MKKTLPTEHDTMRVYPWGGMFCPTPASEEKSHSPGTRRGPKHPIKDIEGETSRSASTLPHGLTPTELAIVEILADGASNREIARQRGCAVGTVKVHLGRIFRKLGVESRGAVIAMAKNIREVQRALMERARVSPFQTEWILQDMTIETRAPGSVLFRRGDKADALFYLEEGGVRLPEVNAFLEAGSVFGEIGVFAADSRRTSSAICETPVRLFRVTADRTWELYVRNPSFAAHLVRLAASRIVDERERNRAFRDHGGHRESQELVTA